MTTFDAAMQALYTAPLMEPFPPGTRWVENDGHVLQWDMRRDVYYAWLMTCYRDVGRCILTNVGITGQELALVDINEHAFQRLVHDKMKLLQMRHYFNLVYDRGGYA